eukprot:scaffold1083_cov164-Pinguiococcus_pyrenoidosus.AAC.1
MLLSDSGNTHPSWAFLIRFTICRAIDILLRRILRSNGDLRFSEIFLQRDDERLVKKCVFQCIKAGLAPGLMRVYSYAVNIQPWASFEHRKLCRFNILWSVHRALVAEEQEAGDTDAKAFDESNEGAKGAR